MKVGICKDYFFENLDPEIEQATYKAIHLLEELGAELVDVSLPSLNEVVQLQGLITSAEAYVYHSKYLKDRAAEIGTNVRDRFEKGQYIPAWAYIEVQRLRKQYQKEWAIVYQKIDLLAAPTTVIAAFPIGIEKTILFDGKEVNPRDLGKLGKTLPSCFNGYPSISVPCGYTTGGLA